MPRHTPEILRSPGHGHKREAGHPEKQDVCQELPVSGGGAQSRGPRVKQGNCGLDRLATSNLGHGQEAGVSQILKVI